MAWHSNDTGMARAAHSFYLRNTYLENNFIEPGKVVLKDMPIDLGKIEGDLYAVGAEKGPHRCLVRGLALGTCGRGELRNQREGRVESRCSFRDCLLA